MSANTTPVQIRHFRGRYGFLSNFHPSPITLDGITYPTAEHAFQAEKTADLAARRKLAAIATPAGAKRAGRKLALIPGWNDLRIAAMAKVLEAKFAPGTELAALLLATGKAELIEGTDTWNDRFWGVTKGVGDNHLGRLLTERRKQLTVEPKTGDDAE